MTTHYEIYPALGLSTITYRDDVRIEDQLNLYQRYTRDPRFEPGLNEVLDLEGSRMNDLYFADALHLVSRLQRLVPERPDDLSRVFLAPDDLSFGLARMLQAVMEGAGMPATVVRTRAEVLPHLNLPATAMASRFRLAWLSRKPMTGQERRTARFWRFIAETRVPGATRSETRGASV